VGDPASCNLIIVIAIWNGWITTPSCPGFVLASQEPLIGLRAAFGRRSADAVLPMVPPPAHRS
jgi:hypothetical protein